MVRFRRKRPELEPEPEAEVIGEDGDGLVTSSLVALHVTLPERHKGHRPHCTHGTADETAADARELTLTCAGLNASWSRQEDLMSWYCDVVACDPPMADGPLRNAEALCGCVRETQSCAAAQEPGLVLTYSCRWHALARPCSVSLTDDTWCLSAATWR